MIKLHTAKKSSQKLISTVASQRVLKQNAEALKSYDYYKKTSDLLDRIDIALGRKQSLSVCTGWTVNHGTGQYGVSSTAAQKIKDNARLE